MKCNVLINSADDKRMNPYLLGLLDMVHSNAPFAHMAAMSTRIVDYGEDNPTDRPMVGLEGVWEIAHDMCSAVQAQGRERAVSGNIRIVDVPTLGVLVHDPEFGVSVQSKDWHVPS